MSTTPMNDFLRARLAERKKTAEEALRVQAVYGEGFTFTWGWAMSSQHSSGGSGSQRLPGAPTPQQVVADCQVKLALIDGAFEWGRMGVPIEPLAALSFAISGFLLEWADHPDFDPKWIEL